MLISVWTYPCMTAVCLGDLVKNRGERIPETAYVGCLAFQFAGHARHAAFIVHVVQAHCLHLYIIAD